MAAVKKYLEHKQIGPQLEVVEIEYDFAKDGGATGALDLIKFKDNVVIHNAWLKIDAAFTASGSATVIYGIKGGDTDAFLDLTSGAKANLTLGAVIPNEAAGTMLKVPADSVVEMTIGTDALLTGKGRFCFLVQNF